MYSDLPEDIIEKILLFLPNKSLFRFKLVQKSWLALISNPNFLAKYLQYRRSKFKDKDTHILVTYRSRNNLDAFSYSILSYDTLQVSATGLLPYPNPPQQWRGFMDSIRIRIIGVCNGVVCLNDTLGFFTVLWSPASDDVKVLPPCPYNKFRDETPYDVIGFSFDIISNAFKVVRVFSGHLAYGQAESYHKVLIYSSNTNSWKEIYPSFPVYEIYREWHTSSSNGFISWIGYKRNGCGRHEVISFDVSNEVFKTTEFPSSQTNGVDVVDSLYFKKIVMLNGHVALLTCNSPFPTGMPPSSSSLLDVWVLLELGVKESWTKLFTIQPPESGLRLLGFWGNGEIYNTSNGNLVAVSHNNVGQELKTLGIDAIEYQYGFFPYDGDIARDSNNESI